MAAAAQNGNYEYFEVDDDTDSYVSTESEDFAGIVECIIAESTTRDGTVIYLVKWLNCPLLRSSWQTWIDFEASWTLDDWEREKQRQAEGKSQPFDIVAFKKLVRKVELAERQRRRLRSFRRQAQSIVKAIIEK